MSLSGNTQPIFVSGFNRTGIQRLDGAKIWRLTDSGAYFMRKIRLQLAITAGLSMLCGSSFAADMPVKAPVLAAVASPSWTGFYAGANLGYGWGDRSPTIAATDPGTTAFIKAIRSGSINPAPFDAGGISGGLQIGYNYQLAPNWLGGNRNRLSGERPERQLGRRVQFCRGRARLPTLAARMSA